MIKQLRTQSVLKELIPEALSTLNDSMLQNLLVTEVKCKRGKYDADVYLDKSMYDEREQEIIISKLKRVSRHLENHCAVAEGWYRCPKFHFIFDDQLEKINKIEKLFKKMHEELEGVKSDK